VVDERRLQARLILVLWAVLALWLGYRFWWSNRRWRLIICAVGQGEAILLTRSSTQILIDGGPSGARLLACLRRHLPFWDRTIELVINTHPEEDHFRGLITLLDYYRVNNYFHNGLAKSKSASFQQLKNKLIEHKVCSRKLAAGDRFRISLMDFKVLWPEPSAFSGQNLLPSKFWPGRPNCYQPQLLSMADSVNNYSVVLQLSYGRFRALLTGDIEAEVERLLVWRQQIKPVTMLKLAHHGSATSTTTELLAAAQPQLALISVGAKNRFGHPSPVVLSRLKARKIPWRRTDQQGDLELVISSTSWSEVGQKSWPVGTNF